MTKRPFNFSAGPAGLPEPVLKRIQSELPDWRDLGVSVMEVSHRHPEILAMAQSAQHHLRTLLNVPDHYEILFCQGGGRGQYSMVPMNLAHSGYFAEYAVTGLWSQMAATEASHWCQVKRVIDTADMDYRGIDRLSASNFNPNAAFFHFVDNETVHGVEFPDIPQAKAPIVSDMTSSLLTQPLDISRYKLIYAACQKNLGIAGITAVIIDPSIMPDNRPHLPPLLDYRYYIDYQSFYNTPPIFPLYVTQLMLEWMLESGGIQPFYEASLRKSEKLYEFIDNSQLFYNPVAPAFRSRINVPFYLTKSELSDYFAKQAEKQGLFGLKGHSVTGGFRASLYNAVSEQAVDALILFMKDFELQHASG